MARSYKIMCIESLQVDLGEFMEEFMSLFQIRTAIPFGYLVFWTIWLFVSAGLAAIVVQPILSRDVINIRFGLGVVGLLFSAFVLYANITFSEALEFNPTFSATDLVGRWKDGASEFQLNEDGTADFRLESKYLSRIGIVNGSGTWKRVADFTITFDNKTPGEQKTLLRVIRYDAEYRIIVEDYMDLDEWDSDLGFRRQ